MPCRNNKFVRASETALVALLLAFISYRAAAVDGEDLNAPAATVLQDCVARTLTSDAVLDLFEGIDDSETAEKSQRIADEYLRAGYLHALSALKNANKLSGDSIAKLSQISTGGAPTLADIQSARDSATEALTGLDPGHQYSIASAMVELMIGCELRSAIAASNASRKDGTAVAMDFVGEAERFQELLEADYQVPGAVMHQSLKPNSTAETSGKVKESELVKRARGQSKNAIFQLRLISFPRMLLRLRSMREIERRIASGNSTSEDPATFFKEFEALQAHLNGFRGIEREAPTQFQIDELTCWRMRALYRLYKLEQSYAKRLPMSDDTTRNKFPDDVINQFKAQRQIEGNKAWTSIDRYLRELETATARHRIQIDQRTGLPLDAELKEKFTLTDQDGRRPDDSAEYFDLRDFDANRDGYLDASEVGFVMKRFSKDRWKELFEDQAQLTSDSDQQASKPR